jgi:hypothetical protein
MLAAQLIAGEINLLFPSAADLGVSESFSIVVWSVFSFYQ